MSVGERELELVARTSEGKGKGAGRASEQRGAGASLPPPVARRIPRQGRDWPKSGNVPQTVGCWEGSGWSGSWERLDLPDWAASPGSPAPYQRTKRKQNIKEKEEKESIRGTRIPLPQQFSLFVPVPTKNAARPEADNLAQAGTTLVLCNHKVSAQSLISWQRKTEKCKNRNFGKRKFSSNPLQLLME